MTRKNENRSQASNGKELRVLSNTRMEMREQGEEQSRQVAGLGVVVDQWVELWPGFKERINKGAVEFDSVVKSFFNHDPSHVLSTTESEPPLVLRKVKDGIEYESPIPPTSYGRDLEINLERGNVKGSSFTFSVSDDKWWEDDDEVTHREVKKLTLYEIGPVTDPAYIQTTAGIRSAQDVYNEYRTQVQARERAEEEARKIEEQKQKEELERQEAALFLMEKEIELLEKELI